MSSLDIAPANNSLPPSPPEESDQTDSEVPLDLSKTKNHNKIPSEPHEDEAPQYLEFKSDADPDSDQRESKVLLCKYLFAAKALEMALDKKIQRPPRHSAPRPIVKFQQCFLCPKVFPTMEQFQDHFRIHLTIHKVSTRRPRKKPTAGGGQRAKPETAKCAQIDMHLEAVNWINRAKYYADITLERKKLKGTGVAISKSDEGLYPKLPWDLKDIQQPEGKPLRNHDNIDHEKVTLVPCCSDQDLNANDEKTEPPNTQKAKRATNRRKLIQAIAQKEFATLRNFEKSRDDRKCEGNQIQRSFALPKFNFNPVRTAKKITWSVLAAVF